MTPSPPSPPSGQSGSPPATAPPKSPTRIAAIDIGSNSIRQIVADVAADGTIRVVDEMRAAPRLGAGTRETRRLDENRMRDALEVLGRMTALSRQLGAERIEAVATSAVRDTANGHLFLDLIREENGLKVRVLDGDAEARLCFRSALAHFELGKGRAVVIDIGGGSLELALSADGLLERLISLPLGALRLTEEFFPGKIKRSRVKKLRRKVRRALARKLPVRNWHGATVIGSGGTCTNIGEMYLARRGLHMAQTVQGTKVPCAEIERILDALVDLPDEERAKVPGLNPARADIIIAGTCVIAEVLERLDSPELTVSSYGIREGLLLETARVRPTIADPGESRRRSVTQLADRSHYEELHSKHVQTLALQIFDQIGERLGCGAGERELLSDAALLHDIGYHINYENHHKHSYHLVSHAELLGITPVEQLIVANVARYHRGPRPKKKHSNFSGLDRQSRRVVKRLSAILRVADGLDRGHSAAVGRVKAHWTDDALELTAVPADRGRDIQLELWGAERKSRLLRKIAGIPVAVVHVAGSERGSEAA
ncbi:MAG TPA: Ppx/GppA phosphatase family protein [Gemmatimonadaceae bacterium]|nr:Ppx/GppA phosphatase family protein [Gemmatimonadaceae bacterium]